MYLFMTDTVWAWSVPDLTSQSTLHVRFDKDFNAVQISFVISN